MSGGHFDYNQHKIAEIADEIERFLSSENNDFTEEVNEEIKFGLKLLKLSYIYAHRIDWLLSGDDGEDDFLRRLLEDFEGIK